MSVKGRSFKKINWLNRKKCSEKAVSKAKNNKCQTMDLGGRVGLNNLGNTCFMNSALQCLSHASPLTQHFLSGSFQDDLNVSNPLGTGGMLANAYGNVIQELWLRRKKNGGNSTSPTAFKQAIALFAPRFNGYLQHDAQEFLAYLLDGLHEDLNRIQKLPYVQMPNVVDEQNMAIASAEAWDAHRRRNDSLITDTFCGQFRSTCVCPKCNRASVSFNPFNHISLEIPQIQKSAIIIPVMLFAASSIGEKNSKPVQYGLSVQADTLVANIRVAISKLCGIPTTRLILCEVYENLICQILQDNQRVMSIQVNDMIAAYEVDPNTNTSIHAIASHTLIDEKYSSSEEEKVSGDAPDSFGFPILTSFQEDLTCREVWDHLWKLVRHMVIPEDALQSENVVNATINDYHDNNAEYKSLLQIRVVSHEGFPLPTFPSEISYDANKAETCRTTLLPLNSDKKIIECLGKDYKYRFLFLSLEWIDKPIVSVGVENEVEVKDNSGSSSMIQESRFLAHEDHPSLQEAIRKQRATNRVKGITLNQCLDTFTNQERLDEHNMWYCSRCKEYVRALKTMELWRLPDILVVHLKRFEFRYGFQKEKLDTFVEFPLDGLDMSKHCAYYKNNRAPSSAKRNQDGEIVNNSIDFIENQVPPTYDLFAVVNHHGQMGHGHYTAFARKWDEVGISHDWNLFDDSSVVSVGGGSDNGVVSTAAYVLFYRRRIIR